MKKQQETVSQSLFNHFSSAKRTTRSTNLKEQMNKDFSSTLLLKDSYRIVPLQQVSNDDANPKGILQNPVIAATTPVKKDSQQQKSPPQREKECRFLQLIDQQETQKEQTQKTKLNSGQTLEKLVGETLKTTRRSVLQDDTLLEKSAGKRSISAKQRKGLIESKNEDQMINLEDLATTGRPTRGRRSGPANIHNSDAKNANQIEIDPKQGFQNIQKNSKRQNSKSNLKKTRKQSDDNEEEIQNISQQDNKANEQTQNSAQKNNKMENMEINETDEELANMASRSRSQSSQTQNSQLNTPQQQLNSSAQNSPINDTLGRAASRSRTPSSQQETLTRNVIENLRTEQGIEEAINKKNSIVELKTLSPNTLEILQKVYSTTGKSPVSAAAKQSLQTVNDILNQPSLRERFEELEQLSPELEIPGKYKYLIDTFYHIDTSLKFFNDRDKAPFFLNLQQNLELAMKSKISINQLQQIMTVYPTAYLIKWEKNESKGKKFDIMINFYKDENTDIYNKKINLQERKNTFKANLLQIVRAFHLKFLKEIGQEKFYERSDIIKTWHPQFDLNQVPDIPETPLPVKPTDRYVVPLEEHVNNAQFKNEFVKEVMKTTAEREKEKLAFRNTLLEESKNISVDKNTTGLSDRLYQMIKQKQMKLNEMKRNESAPKEEQIKQRELKKVAQMIVMFFSQRSVSSMFMVNIIDYLQTNNNAVILSKNDFVNILEILIKICPKWLTKVSLNGSDIIQIDQSIGLKDVFELIDHYNE